MHLMSLVSPVDRDLAVVYSRLLPVPFRQLLIDRGDRVVADVGDRAAVEIEGGQRLQDVVQLSRRELDGDVGVAGDGTDVLEVTDAALI